VGIQGVVVTLSQQDSSGNLTTVKSVMTNADGAYVFDNLAPGTYQIVETQPGNFIAGSQTVGTIGGTASGTAEQNQIVDIQLAANGSGSGYNFVEWGLTSQMLNLSMFYASAPPASQLISQLIAQYDAAPVVQLTTAVAGGAYSATYTSGGSPVAIADASATVTDTDSPMLAWMTATISNAQDASYETLAATTTNTPITSSYANGVLTLAGVASLADYQQVLQTIAYSDTATSPVTGDRMIQVVVNDGIVSSQPVVATITVQQVQAAVDATMQQTDNWLA
jgi:hypothetical protein